MKNRLVVLLIVFIILVIATALFFYLQKAPLPPTQFGWHAQVTTVAGNGAPALSDNSQPRQAAFAGPFGIAIGPDDAIYVADAGESNRIRKIASNGAVTTFAGSSEGYADGPGPQASFSTPSGLAFDQEGNLYVADTGNNRIRRITPEGLVSTIAGDGTAGFADGQAAQSRFDGPIGIAVDAHHNIYVADTYNDRIRLVRPDGQVSTVAGTGRPGYGDGDAASASFDTPCGIVATGNGTLIIADTGNNRLRKIAPDGQVTTMAVVFPVDIRPADLAKPVGLASTHDGFLYLTELDRARVVQVAPSGDARVLAGGGPGYADGNPALFNQPSGVSVDRRGDVYVADSANYLVRKLSRLGDQPGPPIARESLPRLTTATLGVEALLWPLDPQEHPHEVAATMGEVRGSFDSTESRDHLHSGLDVFGAYGDVVRAVRSEKVVGPIANWGFGGLNEGLRVGVISYIHMQVGRDKDSKVFADPRFIQITGDDGKLSRLRVRRGTRFRPGDALGTVNRMYHVHLNVGPPGAEVNPLSFSPIGFSDRIPPEIERDGIQLFVAGGVRLTEKRRGRLLVYGRVQVVVDAFDRTDMNVSRRRLGLYSVGYQVLKADGTSAPGFEEPRMNLIFNRLPGSDDATKLAFAEGSGITVYGSAVTRFLYEVTNIVRDGRAETGVWDTSGLPGGDYILRIIARDFSGNEAHDGRDLLVTVRN